jgi:DNA-binding XRE family transcriptional regulator
MGMLPGLTETEQSALKEIYEQAALMDPLLDEQAFIRNIAADWLRMFTLKEPLNLPKEKVQLRNSLKGAIRRSGMEHRDVATAVGIRPPYLSQVIAGSYDPSLKLALLILDAIRWPVAKIEDVWWLKPEE